MLGLIELLIVLSLAIGWAVFELVALRRDRRKPEAPPDAPQASDPSP